MIARGAEMTLLVSSQFEPVAFVERSRAIP